ncbi:MAG: ATP synthase F1 subunit epsilon [Bacteroidales bacterium]|nr:ATP synthase F1 subunit epsilon [Bacteroidales bacterium]
MKLEILTPNEQLFSGEVQLVSVPGTMGTFEIMPRHAPIISTLTKGTIKIIDKTKTQHLFEIKSGLIESSENKIWILAEK